MLIVILLEKFMASAFRVINEFAKNIYIYIYFSWWRRGGNLCMGLSFSMF